MQIQLTHHALARIRQRGIPATVIEGLLAFGRTEHDHRGSTVHYFDHCGKARLLNEWGKDAYKQLESKLDAYLVLDSNGLLITAGHRTKRINRH